jgi:hypothetical protein
MESQMILLIQHVFIQTLNGAGVTKRQRLSGKRQPRAAVQFIAQHFLYFLPEPQGHGSLRPTLAAGGA